MLRLARVMVIAMTASTLSVGSVAGAFSPEAQPDDGQLGDGGSMSSVVNQTVESLDSLAQGIEALAVPSGLADATLTAEVKGILTDDGTGTWPEGLGTVSLTVRVDASVAVDGSTTVHVETIVRCKGATDREIAICGALGEFIDAEPGFDCKDTQTGAKCTYVADDQT